MNVIRPIAIGDTGSFTRASTKTFIGADGLIHTVPNDIPAFQYSPANLAAAPVPLLEKAATNLVLYSEQVDNAAWTKTLIVVLANSTTAPDGQATADQVTKSSGSAFYSQNITFTAATCTAFAFAKAAGAGGHFSILIQPSYADRVGATFNLNSGAVVGAGSPVGGASSVVDVGMVALPNGWYLCYLTARTAAGAGQIYFAPTENNGAPIDPFSGSVLASAYVWGHQVAVGDRSSYIPTGGATGTRAADVITGTGLIYSNALEVAPAGYNGATTYGFGATASILGSGGLATVYQSLQAGNTNHAPASSPTWWAYIGTTYQSYSGSDTWGLGSRVIDPSAHLVYESLVASNSGHPLSDETKWGLVGATNRWAAFDDVVGTSVERDGPILMLFVPGAIDSLGMLNISAQSSTISVVDPSTMKVVFSQTTNLTDDTSITDYDLYFFEDEVTVSDLYTDSLPPYYSGVLSIALTGVNGASVGVVKMGSQFDLGGTRLGLKVGFVSYTKKSTDPNTGYITARKGNTSKRMTVTTIIDNTVLDKTVRVMEELDGIPTVYIGAGNRFTSLIQFAFCKSFEVEIPYPTNSLCSFEQEGLI